MSKSGPCHVIRTFPPEPLSDKALVIRELARKAVLARKQADKEAYEHNLNLKGLKRL